MYRFYTGTLSLMYYPGSATERALDDRFFVAVGDGRFARFAQATYLLGQVFRHISDQPSDPTFYEEEAAQLNRTLHALIHLSKSEAETRKLEFCTQTAVCFS